MPRKVKLPESFQMDDARIWKKKPVETIVREYRLVTPLFGGGVEPFESDPVTTLRTSEIKGHLRFWWRVLFGWKASGSLKTLLELEESIWGGVSSSKKRSSQVQLIIKRSLPGKKAHPLYLTTNRRGKEVVRARPEIAHPYISFSLEQKAKDSETGKEKKILHSVKQGIAFELEVIYPTAVKSDVESALWAWETFGGLGARTRRGFGAVVPKGFNPPSAEEVRSKLREIIKGGNWPEGVPHLHPDGVFYLYPGSWRNLADAYKNFRQWRGEGREPNKPGRSKWPEPDEIRRLTKTHSPGHKPNHPVHKFPRGQFGLPIIFHFKDGERGDPPDTTLKGRGIERLTSPLGFKPYSEKGPVLVYVLEGSRKLPEPYTLETDRGAFNVNVGLTAAEAAKIEPLIAAGANPDPVEAFVEWLKKEGGKK